MKSHLKNLQNTLSHIINKERLTNVKKLDGLIKSRIIYADKTFPIADNFFNT